MIRNFVINGGMNDEDEYGMAQGRYSIRYLISSLKTKKDGSYDFKDAKPIVLTEDGKTEMFTDEKGYAVSIPIPYGKYIVRETTTPHNFTPVDDFKVTISENHPKDPQQWRVLLDDEFGTAPGECYEVSLNTREAALEASEQVEKFCIERGADLKTAERYALFVEEIACNTIEHGFTDAKRGSLDIRVVYSDELEIIRFRDNGRPFDPVKWLELNHPDDPLKGAGIRIVVGMAKEVRYMPAMGLNNLLIIL